MSWLVFSTKKTINEAHRCLCSALSRSMGLVGFYAHDAVFDALPCLALPQQCPAFLSSTAFRSQLKHAILNPILAEAMEFDSAHECKGWWGTNSKRTIRHSMQGHGRSVQNTYKYSMWSPRNQSTSVNLLSKFANKSMSKLNELCKIITTQVTLEQAG